VRTSSNLSSALSRKRRTGGVPSQRETDRKSGSPDRTAPSTPPPDVPQGSKRISGPPAESENRPKNRRGSTRKARAASPADGNREGTARQTADIETPGRGAPGPPRKFKISGGRNSGNRPSLQARPSQRGNAVTGPADVTRESTSNPARVVEGPQSTPPTADAAKGSNGRQHVMGTRSK
jgi:hypothetical protein